MALSSYLPVENYTLQTSLSVAEVHARIADNLEPKKNRFGRLWESNTKPYEGYISGYQFEISRIIDYRNSFLPVIRGTLIASPGQTRVRITMQLPPLVLVFVLLWLGTVGVVCVGVAGYLMAQFGRPSRDPFDPALLIPFGMFIFGCLLTLLAFKAESRKSKRFLAELLNGQEVT